MGCSVAYVVDLRAVIGTSYMAERGRKVGHRKMSCGDTRSPAIRQALQFLIEKIAFFLRYWAEYELMATERSHNMVVAKIASMPDTFQVLAESCSVHKLVEIHGVCVFLLNR